MIDEEAVKRCFVPCPACGKAVIGRAFDCFYCGESLDINQRLPEDKGENDQQGRAA
jgi:predicted RNA-binding Zn-ribbon protein involved in translation (DUF1610 family)